MDIQTIVSIVSNVMVLLLFFVALISSVIGLKRGLFRSLVSLIVWLIAFAIVFGLNMTFTELYFKIDLSLILKNFGNLAISINGVEVSLLQSVGDIITDIMDAFDLESATEATKALAMSVLSLFVLFFHMIIACCICPIVILIINQTFTKHVIEKLTKKKLRLAGFFVNGLKTAVVFIVILSPSFNILENVCHSFKSGLEDNYQFNDNESNEIMTYAYPAFSGYNNSLLHKLFSVVTGSGTYNSYYTATVNGENNTNVNFMEVIDCVASVAVSVFSNVTDITDEGQITTALLADHTLEVFTNSVLSSTFLMSEALPVALNLGIDMLVSTEDADSLIISEEDAKLIKTKIGDIDFSKDLSSYVTLFRTLNEEGIITDALFDSGSFDYELSRDNQVLVNKALSAFKEAQDSIKNDPKKTTLLDVILPPVLSSLVKNYSNEELPLDTMLPTTPEGYRELDLIEVLQVASDVVFNVNDLYVNIASNNEGVDISNKSYVKKQNDNEKVDNLTFGTINKLFDNSNFVRALFEYTNVFDGAKDSRVSDGTKTIKTIDLFKGSDNDKGILDIEFLLNNFKGVVDFALSSISKNEDFASLGIDNSILDVVADEIKDINGKEEWSKEIDSLLNCVGTIFNNEDFPIITFDKTSGELKTANFEGDDIDWLFADSSIGVIKKLCTYIDDSSIICTVFPAVIKALPLDEYVSNLGLNISVSSDDLNFNFEGNATLGSELSKLFEAFSLIQDIIPEGKDNLKISDFDEDDIRCLRGAFECMVDCQIINNQKKDENGKFSNNLIKKIVVGLTLNNDYYGLSISEDDFDDILENGDLMNELNIICDTLNIIVDKDSSLSSIDPNNFDINKLLNNERFGEDLENLLNTAANSKLMKSSLCNVLEKNLNIEIGGVVLAEYFDFSAINDLDTNSIKVESAKIRQMVEDLRLICNGQNISEVQWDDKILDDANSEIFKRMFKTIESLCFLDEVYYEEDDVNHEKPYDRFGLTIYAFLNTILDNYIDSSNKEQIKKDFSFVYYDEYFKDIDDNTIISKKEKNQLWDNEIDKLIDCLPTIKSCQDTDGNINIDISTNEGIDNIVSLIVGKHDGENEKYGLNDITLLRTILSEILSDQLGSTFSSIGGFDLNDAYINSDVFDSEHELNFMSGQLFIDNYNLNKNDSSLFDKNSTYTYRDVETIFRRKELNILFSLAKDMIELSDGFDVNNIESWVNGDFMYNLLIDVHDSKILHTPSIARENNKITVFEKIIDVILESSVSDLIYKEADPKNQRLDIIKKITSYELLNDSEVSWDDPSNGEIWNLYNAIKSIYEGCKDESGEQTSLYKFLFNQTGSINISKLNEDKNHNEIEVVISSLSKSLLINPTSKISLSYKNNSLLGLILDDNIGSQLNSIGMDNHSFVYSNRFDDDWDKEALAISNLVNTFKSLRYEDDSSINIDDLTNIKWTNIKIEDLRGLLLGIYKVPSINATYETNSEYDKSSYEDIIYYVVNESFSFDSSDVDDIKVDIYSTANWFTENELNGLTETSSGETNKFVNLLESASSSNYGLIDSNGTFDLSKFNSNSNAKNEYGVHILKELNSVDFLRTVFASIFENSFNDIGIAIDGLDTKKVYSGLFNNELNYKNNAYINKSNANRANEIIERGKEIDNIINIVESYNGLNEILDKVGSGNIKSFTSSDIDYSFELLDTFKSSRLFHIGRHNIESNETTFFEDAVILILDKGGIVGHTYDSSRDISYSNSNEKIKAYVRNISFSNVVYSVQSGSNRYLTWDEELATLKENIKTLINVDGLIDDNNEISPNNLTSENIIITLNALNESYLTHDSLGKFIKDICEDSIKVSSFQIDEKETNRKPDYYLDKINYEDDSFILRINAWKNEIDCISDFKKYLSDKGISSVDSIDFENTYSEGSIKIADILSKASELNALKPMFSDFIYTMIKKAGLEKYVSIIANSNNNEYENYINTYESSDSKKEDKMRRDTIDYLSENKIVNWYNEGNSLDNMISSVKKLNAININEKNDIEKLKSYVPTLFEAVYNFNGTTYNYDKSVLENATACSDIINEDKYVRGYLSSELMLNFLDETMNGYGVTYFNEIKYDYSYVCFNDYEKVALESILDIAYSLKSISSLLDLYSFNFSKAKKMGPGESIDSPKRDENKVLLNDGWNSNIAIQLLNNNYLENILNDTFSISLSNIFTVTDKPIEYASNSWGNSIKNAILYGSL